MLHAARLIVGSVALLLCAAAPAADDAPDAADRSLRAAAGLLERGLLDLAEAEYLELLDLAPNHARADEARYGLALARLRAGRPADAIEAIRSIDDPGRDFAWREDLLLLRSRCHLALGASRDAARTAMVLAEEAGAARRGEAAALAVEAWFRAGEPSRAIAADALLRDASAAPGDAARGGLFAALALDAAGRHDEAAQRAGLAAAAEPEGPLAAHCALAAAAAFRAAGRSAEAARAAATAEARGGPTRADARWLRAICEEEAGAARDAAASWDRFLAEERGDDRIAEAALRRARLAERLGNDDDARRRFAAIRRAGGPDAPEAAWSEGRLHLAAGDAARALDAFDAALATTSDPALRDRAAWDRAVALRRLDRPAEAARAFAAWPGAERDPERGAEARHLAAALLLESGDAPAAAEAARAALRSSSGSPREAALRAIRAEALELAGDDAAAAEAWAEFADRHPDDPGAARAACRHGMTLARLGREEEAARLIAESLLEVEPGPVAASAALTLAELDLAAGRFERVIAAADHAATLGADARECRLLRAIALRRGGDPEAALADLDALLADGEEDPHARYERAQALIALGRGAEAETDLARAARAPRLHDAATEQRAALAAASGDARRATVLLAQLDAEGSVDPAARRRRAAILASIGEVDAALALLAPLLNDSRATLHAEATADAATWLEAASRHEDALRRSAALDAGARAALPAAQRAALALAESRAWRATDRPAEALAALQPFERDAALRGAPAAPRAALERADLLLTLGRAEEAEALLAALVEDPGLDDAGRAAASFRHGLIAHRAGHHAEAAPRFEACLERAPTGPDAESARLLAGEARLAAGEPGRAARHFAALADDPGPAPAADRPDPRGAALLRLGEIRALEQRWAESRAAYEKWLEARPGAAESWRAQFGIGQALEAEGRPDRARPWYERVAATHDGPTAARAQFQVGECLFAEGRHDEAIRAFVATDVLYAHPEWSAAALCEAGRCLEAAGDRASARAQYRAVLDRFPDGEWAGIARTRLAALAAPGLPGRTDAGDDR